jgi:arginase
VGRQTVRNRDAIAAYNLRLAGRVQPIVDGGEFLVVLGGDCSIVLGCLLALRRTGRVGLVFIDGHSDFRHLGNSDNVRAAAGEDLALACGLGDPALADPEGLGPLVQPADVVLIGPRADDPALQELAQLEMTVITSPAVRREGAATAAARALERLHERGLSRFWIHIDVDVVDPVHLAAVDSPSPDGLDLTELAELITGLVDAPASVGMQVTTFDPDLDPDGEQAARLADALVAGLVPHA